MSSWPALDVAIGLVFVYFLLSLFASNINEAIATWLKLRAGDLETWLKTVLVDNREDLEKREKELTQAVKQLQAKPADYPDRAVKLKAAEDSLADVKQHLLALKGTSTVKAQSDALKGFFGNPVVRAGEKKADKRPSYVAATAFSAVVTAAPAFADIDELPKTAKEAIENLPSAYLRRVALSLCDSADETAVQLRKKLEGWYDSSMSRVSGWYKRRAQLMLFGIGLALAVGLNVDTLQITRTMWTDATVRAAVVAAASNVAQAGQLQDAKAVADQIKELPATDSP